MDAAKLNVFGRGRATLQGNIDHNSLHHELTRLKDDWRMNQWPPNVFIFLLAVMEVNVYLVINTIEICDKAYMQLYIEFCPKLLI